METSKWFTFKLMGLPLVPWSNRAGGEGSEKFTVYNYNNLQSK